MVKLRCPSTYKLSSNVSTVLRYYFKFLLRYVVILLLMLSAANLTLASRSEQMPRKFFLDISDPSSCLHHLLSGPREQSIASRLRTCENIKSSAHAYQTLLLLYTVRAELLSKQHNKLLQQLWTTYVVLIYDISVAYDLVVFFLSFSPLIYIVVLRVAIQLFKAACVFK